jgi:membrane-associated phospholipid phosphatase
MTRLSRPLCLAASSLSFSLLYALSNHLTSLRRDVGAGVIDWDHAVPFVPWTIVPYLSIVGFFVASFFVGSGRRGLQLHLVRLALLMALALLCYAAFPLRFAFERPGTGDWTAPLFAVLTMVDLPYNRAPSLHIGMLVLLWLRLAPRCGSVARLLLAAWFVLIGVSVLTTWQHHVIDIAAGLAVAAIAAALARPLCSQPWSRYFRSAAWPRPTPRDTAHCKTSTSTSRAAKSSRCWGPTAPARPR